MKVEASSASSLRALDGCACVLMVSVYGKKRRRLAAIIRGVFAASRMCLAKGSSRVGWVGGSRVR